MLTAAAILAAFLVAYSASGPAPAQTQIQLRCGARESILTQLYLNYQEQPLFIGLSDSGNVIEVLVGGGGATWTMISTSAAGFTCIVQTGEHWQAIERQAPSEGS